MNAEEQESLKRDTEQQPSREKDLLKTIKMGVNKEAKAIRQAKVLEKKLEGKTCREIGEEVGVHYSTVSNDYREIQQDSTISDQIDWMKKFSLQLAQKGMVVEDAYIDQIQNQEDKKSNDMSVVTTIAEKARKNYSFLEGIRSNDKGGDSLPEGITADELIKLAYGEDNSSGS